MVFVGGGGFSRGETRAQLLLLAARGSLRRGLLRGRLLRRRLLGGRLLFGGVLGRLRGGLLRRRGLLRGRLLRGRLLNGRFFGLGGGLLGSGFSLGGGHDYDLR